MIRVAIVDDHAVVLDGIISFLQVREDIEVVGRATSGEELFTLLEHNEVDVVISDYRMPEMNGTELLQKIRAQYPEIKVIIFTIVREQKVMAELVRNGAVAFLNKNSSGKELIDTIYTVHKGKVSFDIDVFQSAMLFWNSNIKSHTLRNRYQKVNDDTNTRPYHELDISAKDQSRLSRREVEILGLLAQGFSATEIAKELYKSANTIRSHVQNIDRKSVV